MLTEPLSPTGLQLFVWKLEQLKNDSLVSKWLEVFCRKGGLKNLSMILINLKTREKSSLIKLLFSRYPGNQVFTYHIYIFLFWIPWIKTQRKTLVSKSLFKWRCSLEECNFVEKGLQRRCFFSCDFCSIFKNTHFIQHLQMAPSDTTYMKVSE